MMYSNIDCILNLESKNYCHGRSFLKMRALSLFNSDYYAKLQSGTGNPHVMVHVCIIGNTKNLIRLCPSICKAGGSLNSI